MRIFLYFSHFIFFFNAFVYSEFYSEHNQDEFVFNNFFSDKIGPGIFVDIGAHDGISNSNTYFFEKHLLWKGLCIEPNRALFHQLRINRHCKCFNVACSNATGHFKFLLHPVSFVSGLKDFLGDLSTNYYFSDGSAKEIMVFCMRLNDLLEQEGLYEVDFLSIDTEGADKAILESIDFNRFDIKVIAVEGEAVLFKSFLENKGYKYYNRIGNDSIFAKSYITQSNNR